MLRRQDPSARATCNSPRARAAFRPAVDAIRLAPTNSLASPRSWVSNRKPGAADDSRPDTRSHLRRFLQELVLRAGCRSPAPTSSPLAPALSNSGVEVEVVVVPAGQGRDTGWCRPRKSSVRRQASSASASAGRYTNGGGGDFRLNA